jgi:hypothetical protein
MATRASTRTSTAFSGWTWQAVLAGVFMSLVIQVLLAMLGLGVGLLSVDIQTADAAPRGAGWAAFVWWAVSGIIAAFVGGAIAAANSPDQTAPGRVAHAVGSWAVATVLVVAATTMTAGTTASVASNLAGPSYAASARIAALSPPSRQTTGSAQQTAPSPAQIEEAKKHFAYVMLASFFALLCGAGAAYASGMYITGQLVREAAEPIT